MNTKDLEVFLKLAHTENMQQVANECDKAPSVLSKALKRVESELGVSLFDRVGKHIKLNDVGRQFSVNAAKIVAQTKQSIAECTHLQVQTAFRVAAPSIVLFRWASVISKTLQQAYTNSAVHFQTAYELQALEQVKKGRADIAIITSALHGQIPSDMHVAALGRLTMQIAAGKSHPLVNKANKKGDDYCVSLADLTEHSFVSPSISPYCGEARGLGCDGWINTRYPRKITMVANDYGVLGQLVKSGQALAYIPDYWLRELGLVQLTVPELTSVCYEQILLVSYQQNLTNIFDEA